MSLTTPVSRSTSTSTAWAPNGHPGAVKPFPSPDGVSCPKSFAFDGSQADDLRDLRFLDNFGKSHRPAAFRRNLLIGKTQSLGRQVPEPSCCFQQLSPGICRSELYGSTDIGRYPARISAVVEGRQLRIRDDNRDFVQGNTEFFCGDLAEARSGSTADVCGADKQLHLAGGVYAHARVRRGRRSRRRLVQERNTESMVRGGMCFPAFESAETLKQTIPQRDVICPVARWSFVALIETVFQT